MAHLQTMSLETGMRATWMSLMSLTSLMSQKPAQGKRLSAIAAIKHAPRHCVLSDSIDSITMP